MRRFSEEHSDLTKQYSKLQSSIVKEVIEMTGTYIPVLDETNRLVAELDVYVAFAESAVFAPIPYIRPTIVESNDIILEGARHPCVEMQEDLSFIENDVSLVDGNFIF